MWWIIMGISLVSVAPSASAETMDAASATSDYTADSSRDPFLSWLPSADGKPVTRGGERPATEASSAPVTSAPSGVKIEGVIWGGPRPQAVIDGKVYDVGDVVQGARIRRIGPDGVITDVQGRDVQWRMPSSLKEEQ
jgi:hypothetical protein